MKIRFTEDHTVAQASDGKGPQYKKGEVHTFTGLVEESYARKYVLRGIAVDVATEAKQESTASAFKQESPQAPKLGLGVSSADAGGGSKPEGRPQPQTRGSGGRG